MTGQPPSDKPGSVWEHSPSHRVDRHLTSSHTGRAKCSERMLHKILSEQTGRSRKGEQGCHFHGNSSAGDVGTDIPQKTLPGKEKEVQTSSARGHAGPWGKPWKVAVASNERGERFHKGQGASVGASLSHSVHCKERDFCSAYLSACPWKLPTLRLGNQR